MRRVVGCVVVAAFLSGAVVPVAAQPFSAQIQQALAAFLRQAHTWTATQTFANIVVSGCTGCGGGTAGGSTTQVQYNNAGALAGFGAWDGSYFNINGGDNAFQVGDPTYTTSEAELFGGATQAGLFAQADGGSLFVNAYALSGQVAQLIAGASRSSDATAFELRTVATSTEASLKAIGAGNVDWGAVQWDPNTIGMFLNGPHVAAAKVTLQVWDVNDAVYREFLVGTAGNTPTLVIAPPTGGTVSLSGAYVAAGVALAVANVGANSCGTTAATIAGNSNSFEVIVGATAGTQCRVAFPVAAPTRWNCASVNTSTAALARAANVDTTHVDLLGAFTAGDVISAVCSPR